MDFKRPTPECRRRLVALVAAIVLAVPLAAPSRAADGRDFAGFYVASVVTELGEQAEVGLTVRVFNYSDADVLGARIILEDSLVAGQELGSFGRIVDIRDRESVRAHDTFLVPRREYEQWREGARPHLRIEFTDAGGLTRRAPVELAPMPVGEED